MISHEKKLIFIHIPKTGGMTFSKFLRPYCDEESLRFSPYNTINNLNFHSPLYEYFEHYGKKNIGDYKIVSICRNPWDKALSMFMHQNRDDKKFDKEKFTDMLSNPHIYGLEPHSHFFFWQKIRIGDLSVIGAQGWFHRNNPSLKVFLELGCFRIPDYRISFENYAHNVGQFFDECGIKYDKEELQTKTNTTMHTHYSDYYTEETEKIVGSTCQLDLIPGVCTPEGSKFELKKGKSY